MSIVGMDKPSSNFKKGHSVFHGNSKYINLDAPSIFWRYRKQDLNFRLTEVLKGIYNIRNSFTFVFAEEQGGAQ